MKPIRYSLLLLIFTFTCLSEGAAAAAPLTEQQVLDKYRAKVESRLLPRFRYAGVDWPPQELQLLVIKETRQMELWARSESGWHYIRDYRIKGMSGGLGPKLKEGDRQVPEGSYRISRLNPNSSFHLSMKVDYPNAHDRKMAQRDGRRRLGGRPRLRLPGGDSGDLEAHAGRPQRRGAYARRRSAPTRSRSTASSRSGAGRRPLRWPSPPA